jgi:phosphoadenosine phosphosulfate reductase
MANEIAKLWKDGAFQADSWQNWPQKGALDAAADALVPLARFIAEPDCFLSRTGRLGVRVAPGEDIAALAAHLPKIALIALDFPSFADGRNYSVARLLRERFGYGGEIRAVGDVLSDQIALMRRCGIDAFLTSHGPTQEALEGGRIPEVRHYYQPISGPVIEIPAGSRPWARRPAA